MDGRIQEPLIKYLKENYAVSYVDTVTEPGPCKILADREEKALIDSIFKKVSISVNKHGSKLIAVSAHYDCAGNPSDDKIKKEQIEKSVSYLKEHYPDIKIVGLWINEEWQVQEIA